MQRTHTLKCWPGPFETMAQGKKNFEWRKDDRAFEEGDQLILKEFDPSFNGGSYTGRELSATVTYVLRGRFGVPDGYAVLGIRIPTVDLSPHVRDLDDNPDMQARIKNQWGERTLLEGVQRLKAVQPAPSPSPPVSDDDR